MADHLDVLLTAYISEGTELSKTVEQLLSKEPDKVQLDKVLRELQFKLCEAAEDDTHSLECLLELALECSERDLSNADLPLSMLEEMMDTQTIAQCNRLFTFLERFRRRMTSRMGKGQALLRLCNELLRRLSKTEDTVFCGRILIFLSLVFPLSERSAVNLRGEYNTDNVTIYEDNPSFVSDLEETPGQLLPPALQEIPLADLYPKFWSLQAYFSNPEDLLSSPVKLSQFRTSMTTVIDLITKLSSSGGEEPKLFPKGRAAESGSGDQNFHDLRGFFTPKMLTSPKLLVLELADAAFRKHFLVQILILTDFLLKQTATNKEKLSQSIRISNKSMTCQYTLPEVDVAWVLDLGGNARSVLINEPNGRKFLEVIENLIEHDGYWLRWKNVGCPAYEKPQISAAKINESRKKLEVVTGPRRSYQYSVGNAVLTKLWNATDASLGSTLQTTER